MAVAAKTKDDQKTPASWGKTTTKEVTLADKTKAIHLFTESGIDTESNKFKRFVKAFVSMGNKAVHSTESSYEYIRLMEGHEKLDWPGYWKLYTDTAKAYAEDRIKAGQGTGFRTKDYSSMSAEELAAEEAKVKADEAKAAAKAKERLAAIKAAKK